MTITTQEDWIENRDWNEAQKHKAVRRALVEDLGEEAGLDAYLHAIAPAWAFPEGRGWRHPDGQMRWILWCWFVRNPRRLRNSVAIRQWRNDRLRRG